MITPDSQPDFFLSQADKTELRKLISVLELSTGTTIIFAIAPESSPQHIVVKQLKEDLDKRESKFNYDNFFYSENSFHNYLYSLDDNREQNQETERRLVMVFGIDQLPKPRLSREMQQLNLGREELFGRNLILIFWLNRRSFIDEFRQRAPDFWDWREKIVEFQTRNLLIYPYLEWLIAENSYLKMSGVMQVNRQVDIFLDQIYVSLQAQWRKIEVSERSHREIPSIPRRSSHKIPEMNLGFDDWDEPTFYVEAPLREELFSGSSTTTVTQKVDLHQAVRENQYSVILGAPGAGKTTLLRYLAFHFAKSNRDDQETVVLSDRNEELGKTLLPIFLRIAEYAERLKQQPELTLTEYLQQSYRHWETYFSTDEKLRREMVEFLLYRISQGQCLILLDGLDEVFDQESRKQIVLNINKFVDQFFNNKFVVTSRIAGYRDVRLSDRFAEFTIEDMDTEQVERFLSRWCQTIDKAQQPDAAEEQWIKKGNEQTQLIIQAIADNEGVKRLTANPLLLTILALIHRNGERLPNRRVRLYELAVQTLTEDWQLSKKLPDAPKVILKESELVEILAPLAYWMHEEKPSGLVTQAEVEQKLAEKLAELHGDEPESNSIRQAVEDFLRRVRETTGLFVERHPGVYGFMHLTFEEYFTARYIADQYESEILSLIQQHLYEPRWNEPLLLALGYYGGHFPKRFKGLLEQLFNNLHLQDYEPRLEYGEIKIKHPTSNDPIILYLKGENESVKNLQEAEFKLKDLLFAGQIISEIEVSYIKLREKPIQKLVFTYLGMKSDFDDEIIKQILKLLRKIEHFYEKNEVINLLKQAANDPTLSEEIRIKAKTAILYVISSESTELVDYVTEIVNNLEPLIFDSISDLVEELGEEITFSLENSLKHHNNNEGFKKALNFLIGISCIRKDKYDTAIIIFDQINEELYESYTPFLCWSLGKCYRGKEEYQKSLNYYQTELAIVEQKNNKLHQALVFYAIGTVYKKWGKYEQSINYHIQSRDLYQQLGKDTNVANQWYNIGDCYREWGKYEQAVDCQNQVLAIRQQLGDQNQIALAYHHLGRIYQGWGKYEQAINYHIQSRDLDQQLGEDNGVGASWYWMGDCYREWGKYEQAVDCQNQDLAIRQQLDDQVNLALAYFQLGRIYQGWSKYEQAVTHYIQSRDLNQQLGEHKGVAASWYFMGLCYREWGKYEQAVDCQNQDLAIRQQLDDQVNLALAYYQLGRIYQGWGKYEQAITHYIQSRDLYQQLGKDKDVADSWYWMGDCYREWGKYELAVDCLNQVLAIRQQLDDQVNIADAYYQLGRIYQGWGKYEQAINYYIQSRDLYQQLGKDINVANLWYWMGDCYREWGKYELAVDCQNQVLAIRQQLGDQNKIALAYYWLARIYQEWGKYEQAINYHIQSRDLYQQLGKDKDVADSWYWMGDCYREWGKYEQAVDCQNQDLAIQQQLDDQNRIALAYYQLGRIYQGWGKYEQAITHYSQSCDLYQQLELGKYEIYMSICFRRIANCQSLLVYKISNLIEVAELLTQAEENIYQSIKIDTTGEYKEYLAYDYISFSLIYSQRLHLLSNENSTIQEYIGLFEQHYHQGLTYLDELGKTVDKAEQVLDIARVYLDVQLLENLDQAEEMALSCLQVFQERDRPTLKAAAYKLLGEIHLKRDSQKTAHQFLTESLKIYRELDIQEKAQEVELLIP
jgi:tetratricopeptide (TPR) repeat protein